jgi:hypothetical protein
MTQSVIIQDGSGSKSKATVNGDAALHVINLPFPPLIAQKTNPFRQYFTTDGLAAGTNNMAVDGSSTNVDYFIPASQTKDRYLTNLNFLVAYGASGAPYQWADGTPLTNGSRLFYTSKSGENDIHDAIKTNQDLFRTAFQLIPNNWEVRNTNASNDYGYFISMDLRSLGLPFGVKLDRGTNQKLIIRIRDNTLTSADTFDCIAYGFERFE